MSYPYVDILTAPYVYYASFNAVECFKMHCNVSQKLVTHLQRFPWMRATLSNDEVWFSNEAWISSDCFESLATFSNEDENEDEDWYDRLGPGTRTSSTAVFRLQGGKTFCASFCASFIAGSRRAFLCVEVCWLYSLFVCHWESSD